jgi:hypothetical protein
MIVMRLLITRSDDVFDASCCYAAEQRRLTSPASEPTTAAGPLTINEWN